ncbi:MAG: hypothetical protein J7L90_00540, partial [Dehalococcoidia bacterium]|nr:hypothetical protein [Dehalococcoidia bacterium]
MSDKLNLKKIVVGAVSLALLVSIILPVSLLVTAATGAETLTQDATRYVYVKNFEDQAFENYPTYLTLAFPDGSVSQGQLRGMHIKGTAGDDIPYQIEDNSVYDSGYVKWAGVWLLVNLQSNEFASYVLTFDDSVPDYGNFGTIAVKDKFIDIETESFSDFSVKYDKGLAWASLKDSDGRQLLKRTSGLGLQYDSVWEVSSQGYNVAPEVYDKRIRYGENISRQCTIDYERGSLFVKVNWEVVDDFGNTHRGWFRVWKHQPIIEFWTEGVAPVSEDYPQAYVGYKLPCTGDIGTSFNSGTINYVKSGDESLALTYVLYTNPTNFFGEVSGYGESFSAEVGQDGTLGVNYQCRDANFSQIKGRAGVPMAVLLKKSPDIETDITRYVRRPIASYYCQAENEEIKSEIVDMVRDFLWTYEDEFRATWVEDYHWNQQKFKVLASLAAFGLGGGGVVDDFVEMLKGFSVAESRWESDASQSGQSYPNVLTAAYFFYQMVPDPAIVAEVDRLINEMRHLNDKVRPMVDYPQSIGRRTALYNALLYSKKMTDNANVDYLLNQLGTSDWLYDSPEAFRMDYFPKYKIYGQGGEWLPYYKSVATLVTSHYLANPSLLLESEYELDWETWMASYGMVQNSITWRTLCEMRPDDMKLLKITKQR